MEKAKKVKEFLLQHPLFGFDKINGIGIGKVGKNDCVHVTFEKETDLSDYPYEVNGIYIDYEVIGKIVAQGVV